MLPDPALPLPASLMSLLACFQRLFTAPSFHTLCALAAGFLAHRQADRVRHAYRVLWDMLRDAELPAHESVMMALDSLAHEDHLNLATVLAGQVAEALASYTEPRWALRGWGLLADRALQSLLAAAGEGIGPAEPALPGRRRTAPGWRPCSPPLTWSAGPS